MFWAVFLNVSFPWMSWNFPPIFLCPQCRAPWFQFPSRLLVSTALETPFTLYNLMTWMITCDNHLTHRSSLLTHVLAAGFAFPPAHLSYSSQCSLHSANLIMTFSFWRRSLQEGASFWSSAIAHRIKL